MLPLIFSQKAFWNVVLLPRDSREKPGPLFPEERDLTWSRQCLLPGWPDGQGGAGESRHWASRCVRGGPGVLTWSFDLLVLVADVHWSLKQIVLTAEAGHPRPLLASECGGKAWCGETQLVSDVIAIPYCVAVSEIPFLYLSSGQSNVFQGSLRAQWHHTCKTSVSRVTHSMYSHAFLPLTPQMSAFFSSPCIAGYWCPPAFWYFKKCVYPVVFEYGSGQEPTNRADLFLWTELYWNTGTAIHFLIVWLFHVYVGKLNNCDWVKFFTSGLNGLATPVRSWISSLFKK